MIDSFGAIFLMGGLAASGYIDWRIATGLLVVFLLLSIESSIRVLHSRNLSPVFCKIRPHRNSHSPRNRQRRLFFLPSARIPGWSHRLLDIGGAIAIVAMTAMAIFAAVTHTLALYHQETLLP